MATTNPITGDSIQTKHITQQYRDNYDAIFRKKDEKKLQNSEKVGEEEPKYSYEQQTDSKE